MFSLLAIKGFSLLLIAGYALGLDCEMPPKDNNLMRTLLDCLKAKQKFCVMKCVGEGTGTISPEGNVNKTRMSELMSDFPEGGLKDALTEINKKCYKESARYHMKDKDCIGFARTGMCFVTVLNKRCPGIAKMIKDNL